jgi:hypothetical protein
LLLLTSLSEFSIYTHLLNLTKGLFWFPLSDDCKDIRVSQVGADSEAVGKVEGSTKKIEPTGDMGTHELIVQDPSDTGPKDFIDKG